MKIEGVQKGNPLSDILDILQEATDSIDNVDENIAGAIKLIGKNLPLEIKGTSSEDAMENLKKEFIKLKKEIQANNRGWVDKIHNLLSNAQDAAKEIDTILDQ